MKAKPTRSQIQQAILENSRSLLDSAILLRENGRILHGAHFAATCLEECAKLLMHLEEIEKLFDPKLTRNHFKKNELIGVFHYIAGALSVTYVIRRAADEGLLGGSSLGQDLVMQDLLDVSGVYDSTSLSKIVKKFLEYSESDEAPKNPLHEINQIRKDTVYCDLIDGLIKSPTDHLDNKRIYEIIDDAQFAVKLLDLILTGNFQWDELIETYLKNIDNLEEKVQEIIQEARALKDPQPNNN